MLDFVKLWLELKTDRRAVTALEYGVIAALVIGVAAAGFTALGNGLEAKLTALVADLT